MKARLIHREPHQLFTLTSNKLGMYSVFLSCCFCSIAAVSIDTQASTQTQNIKPRTAEQIQEKRTASSVMSTQRQSEAIQLAPIVVTAAKSARLDRINAVELSRVAILTTPDLLQGQAGLHTGDANGGGLDVNIRGVQGQSRVAISVDGAQQSLDVYRGYAGMQNRSYVDPMLISSVTVEKGPSNKAGGAVGGTVAMQTLNVDDILPDGRDFGARVLGQFGDNANKADLPPQHRDDRLSLERIPLRNKTNLISAEARSGSLAAAWRSDQIDLIAAYAQREQGNYFSGRHGWSDYRRFNALGQEQQSVAKAYAPGEEVLNSSAQTRSFLLKTMLRYSAAQRMNLSYINTHSQYGDSMPSDLIRSGNAGVNQYPLGQNKIQSLSAQYTFQPSEQPLLDFTASLWGTHAQTNQLSASFFSPEALLFRSDRGWSPLDNRRVGLELSNKSTWHPIWGNVTLTISAAAQHERLKPQSGLNITWADLYSNKVLRDAQRQALSGGLRLDYEATDRVRLWAGLNYSDYKSRDYNKNYFPIKENRRLKQVEVWDEKNNYLGYMYWFPNEKGEYTQATDPRLNNAIVFSNSNQPYVGKPFNTLSQDPSVTVYDEEELKVISRYQGRAAAEQRDHAWSPYLGGEYDLSDQMTTFVRYTVQSRLPSLLETSLGTHQVMPGQQLKPEMAKSWELGLKSNHGNGLSSQLSYFNQRYEDYISRYYQSDRGGSMTFSNMDSFQSSGIELQLKYAQPRYFVEIAANHYLKVESCDAKFAEKLRREASPFQPTYNTPSCTAGGFMGSYLNMQNPPKVSSHLTLGYFALDQRLTLGIRTSYHAKPMSDLSQAWQSSPTTMQLQRQPVYLMDVFADYKLHKNMSLDFSIRNLSNQYYLEPMASSYMPAPGRSMHVGAKLFF